MPMPSSSQVRTRRGTTTHASKRYDGREGQDQPVGDVGGFEQRLMRQDQRLGGQRRETPPDIAVTPSPPEQRQQEHQQRPRREDPRQRRHDHDEVTRLARRDLREPGDPFVDHVPLQPVDARPGGREDSSLPRDPRARRDRRVAEIGADPVVVRHGARAVRELARHQPQPVIREVNARRIPGAIADVGHGHRHGDFLRRLEDARRGCVEGERQVIRRREAGAAPRREQRRGQRRGHRPSSRRGRFDHSAGRPRRDDHPIADASILTFSLCRLP